MKNHHLKNLAFSSTKDQTDPGTAPRKLAQKMRLTSDSEGHYDMDGVSFEKSLGVIVASDGKKDRLPSK